MRINPSVSKKLKKQLYENIRRRVRPTLKSIAFAKFTRAKSILIEEIKAHPISQSIEAHEHLFGFLGFEEHESPIDHLVNFFNNRIAIREGALNKRTNLMNLNIHIPSKGDMLTDDIIVEWNPRVPWPEMVETGIPYLQYFLRGERLGRSDEGVQAHGKLSDGKGDYPKVKYLSVILGNFRKNLIK